MAKAPAPPGRSDKISLATLKQKVGPLPLWGWGVIALVAYYVYTRYYSGAATTVAGTEEQYGADTYSGYVPEGGYTGFGDVSGGGAPGAEGPEGPQGVPGEVPIGQGPGEGASGHPSRRHRIERIKRKSSRRIAAIKEGGVTKPERGRIQQIKQRRKSRIKKIRTSGRR